RPVTLIKQAGRPRYRSLGLSARSGFGPQLCSLSAEFVFLHLSAGSKRKLTNESYIFWDLVVGNLSTAKILDVLRGYIIALLEDYKRADLFSIFFTGNPDDLHVLNTLHSVNELLDFARR